MGASPRRINGTAHVITLLAITVGGCLIVAVRSPHVPEEPDAANVRAHVESCQVCRMPLLGIEGESSQLGPAPTPNSEDLVAYSAPDASTLGDGTIPVETIRRPSTPRPKRATSPTRREKPAQVSDMTPLAEDDFGY
jgi:hypothetical protein